MSDEDLDPRTEHLHIFLLKKKLGAYMKAIRFDGPLPKPMKIDQDEFDFEGLLYMFPMSGHVPKWLSFLEQGVSGIDVRNMKTRHFSAILFLTVDDRQFAIPFGFGRFKLNMTSVERDFGIKVMVNMVEGEAVTGMTTRDFQAVSISHDEQATRETRLEQFAARLDEELLNQLSGIPEDRDFAKSISGSDGLKMARAMLFKDLGTVCRRLVNEHESEAYRERGFRAVDNMRPVNDPTLIDQLDALLVEDLRNQNPNVQLSAPDDIRRDEISHFAFSVQRARIVEGGYLKIEDWYDRHSTKLSTLEPRQLKQWIIESFSQEGERISAAPLYLSFLHEVTIADQRYILYKGKWHLVAKSFIKSINDFLDSIRVKKSELLKPVPDKDEDDYLKMYRNKADYSTFHKKNFQIDGRPIEPCDLYGHNGKLIHVKCWSSSATFSHLLAQGWVSAVTCRYKEDFRKHMIKHVKLKYPQVEKLFGSEYSPSRLTVAFALIREEKGEIPFFSKLNMYSTGQKLQGLGYDVEYHLLRP